MTFFELVQDSFCSFNFFLRVLRYVPDKWLDDLPFAQKLVELASHLADSVLEISPLLLLPDIVQLDDIFAGSSLLLFRCVGFLVPTLLLLLAFLTHLCFSSDSL